MSGFFVSRVESHFSKNPIKFKPRSNSSQETNIATTSNLINKFKPKKASQETDNDLPNSIPEMIQAAVPEFNSKYSFFVNPLLSSGHTQTAYTALNKFENQHKVHYKREIITVENKTYTLPNGDQLYYDQWKGESTIALDYAVDPALGPDLNHEKYKPESQTRPLPPRTEYKNPNEDLIGDDEKPLLIILHGLSGGSYEAYLRAVVDKIIDPSFGFDAVVINSRGCANHTITSPQLYNGLWTNDVRYVINEIVSKRWPRKRVFLMGFSLGAAILANYLGQEGAYASPQIKGSVAIGCPWDFVDGSFQLRESVIGHYIYSPTMANNLLKLLNNHHILLANDLVKEYKEDPTRNEIKFLKQFDNKFTAKMFGLNSADEYYRKASPIQRLLKVRVPMVILSSLDDPVVGSRSLPFSEVDLNPYVSLITTSVGGHLGWFAINGDRWYVEPVCKLLTVLNQYDVDKESIVELPVDISETSWKYDRLVNGMLVDE
ncbi:acyltransferase, putative [Candida dubliniensis CD36]|uniref:Acyltransferase, putative n=1 Tax=Candida dubliniensis (strain CD36 / ATCC MYA-646 / CBS 7987 / NCPF 3949 / NRRL Y-17841) TaxID=573826 RepID=B9WC27_CANDC|nr:acyltransferase, putative [Candida dubliniensis CD36]CAX43949.1 acyltransferase, putative [Candida dubliniensis CD36]